MQRHRVLQAILASASATIFPVPASAQGAFDVAGKPLQGGHRQPDCGARPQAGTLPFEVHNIAANATVWTGQGEQVVDRFPALVSLRWRTAPPRTAAPPRRASATATSVISRRAT